MAMLQGIQSYFSKLSPLAEKISRDISQVKSAYSPDDWLGLTLPEQENIVNNHFIKPEIYIKYFNKTKPECSPKDKIDSPKLGTQTKENISKDEHQHRHMNDVIYTFNGKNLHSFIFQNVGLKVLHDENTGDYRDEHSFPFSYRTKSQINIPSAFSDNVDIHPVSTDVCHQIILLKVEKETMHARPTTDLSVAKEINNTSRRVSSMHEYDRLNQRRYDDGTCSFNTDEKSNLLSNFGSKNSIASDLSDENESKDLFQEENAKLLSPAVQIPQGFDFLSNW
ncbi:uncharacterized protein LOC111070795 [Drosophila obscura]|uniref:uncharacterized protein LOC111070795 n=1 Tax=Drosophila obscura TaxID=7282 RepID=UPI001BB2A3AC|nr:uncharacterized protein LOC111070795 [Drosophila obscura]XP_041449326.1 uncharacterized protein LOC111070795 [Drosophila obscura]XP_041449328.1 uncharacterized protein LOC111070795 [Drosophila obscura]